MSRPRFTTTLHELGIDDGRVASVAVHQLSKPAPPPMSASSLPTLILHGFSGSGLTMASLGVALAGDGPVLLPDLPHHGRTRVGAKDSPPLSMPQAVTLLADLLDLLDISSCNLIGYSMGARTALSLAATYPDRVGSLVLISGTPGLRDEAERAARRDRDNDLATRITDQGLEWFRNYWDSLELFGTATPQLSAPLLALVREELEAAEPDELARSLRGMGTGSMPPLHDVLPSFPLPVLLVVGAQDHKYRTLASLMADQLPAASVVLVDDAAHRPHLDDPVAVANAVNTFLAEAKGDQ